MKNNKLESSYNTYFWRDRYYPYYWWRRRYHPYYWWRNRWYLSETNPPEQMDLSSKNSQKNLVGPNNISVDSLMNAFSLKVDTMFMVKALQHSRDTNLNDEGIYNLVDDMLEMYHATGEMLEEDDLEELLNRSTYSQGQNKECPPPEPEPSPLPTPPAN